MTNLLSPRRHGPEIRATARASRLPAQQYMGVNEAVSFFGVSRETMVKNWPRKYGFPRRVDIRTGKPWEGNEYKKQAYKIADLRAWLVRWGFEK